MSYQHDEEDDWAYGIDHQADQPQPIQYWVATVQQIHGIALPCRLRHRNVEDVGGKTEVKKGA
ncbi:50S ribosomal protein L32 [Reinekea blandensis MED297]|uniref:50S ribosomal protein L32 n=1 Tax=Reinekea blandensis MED297 TaxID=314283 RepID=A4BDZ7_9GAMM|nr:50S ribosomal protein L32 [Reinekea blandensis MED297]